MSEEYTCRDLLRIMVERDGTDVLLSVGKPPQMRISKELKSFEFEPLTPEHSRELAYQVMNDVQHKALEDQGEVDFSFGIQGLSRFRVNVYIQRGTVSAAFRRIPYDIFSFEELGLPPVVREMSDKPNGLILVTGPTGSGKSTTMAAMIDRINEQRYCHIITIEDPIEYLHQHKRATVDQREIHADTKSFHSALRSILRQDPDVVLLGEMRDAESIQVALTIAETGHLVFATLHTNSCSQTLARIVDVFPGEKQQQVRTQLAMCLNCVMTQVLLPKVGGGLQLALELMVAVPAVRSCIRENKLHTIDNQISMGSRYGMQSLNQSLASLVINGYVEEDEAVRVSLDVENLHKCING
jgi:twitching motility protein PilT